MDDPLDVAYTEASKYDDEATWLRMLRTRVRYGVQALGEVAGAEVRRTVILVPRPATPVSPESEGDPVANDPTGDPEGFDPEDPS